MKYKRPIELLCSAADCPTGALDWRHFSLHDTLYTAAAFGVCILSAYLHSNLYGSDPGKLASALAWARPKELCSNSHSHIGQNVSPWIRLHLSCRRVVHQVV